MLNSAEHEISAANKYEVETYFIYGKTYSIQKRIQDYLIGDSRFPRMLELKLP